MPIDTPSFHGVIPLGFEPKTHALEGRCSNPTELRNQNRLQKYGFLLILQNTFLKKLLYSSEYSCR